MPGAIPLETAAGDGTGAGRAVRLEARRRTVVARFGTERLRRDVFVVFFLVAIYVRVSGTISGH
jgi:hypothetical protein